MHMKLIAAITLATASFAVRSADAASCESLARLSLPHTTITLANTVDAGTFVPLPTPRGAGAATPAGAPSRGRGGAPSPFADLPAFCRVVATLMPSADSAIKIEVWLPISNWNGKFVIPGNGGFAGAINPTPLAAALRS